MFIGFGRLSKMVPFLPVFDVLTYALVILLHLLDDQTKAILRM